MSLERVWYGGHWLVYPLLPLSWIYRALVGARRLAYRGGWIRRHAVPVPVIIVGNLTVGGTGKTPLVLWLADFLSRQGLVPGIITGGYRGGSASWPRTVTADADPLELGDESVLLARRSGCPVAAGPDRVAAARLILRQTDCDIIIADDGLQHYRLERDLEILMVDGTRGFGNGHCLPAGPLREPRSQARRFDLKVCTGEACPQGDLMELRPGALISLRNPTRTRALSDLRGQRVTAVAAIGNPERFFSLLRRYGLHLDELAYRDHHPFTAEDAALWPPGPVVMTEKDAIKCLGFAGADHWYLPVHAVLSPAFEQQLSQKLKGLIDG
jgi:tetraacyldisaccharide 4'-kinase